MNIFFYFAPLIFLTPFPFEWKKHFYPKFRYKLQKEYELKYYRYFSNKNKLIKIKEDKKQRNIAALNFAIEQLMRLTIGLLYTAFFVTMIIPEGMNLITISVSLLFFVFLLIINIASYIYRINE